MTHTRDVEFFISHLFVLEFLFFSGEVYYTTFVFGGGGSAILLFFFTSLAYAFMARKKYIHSKRNFSRLLLYVFLVLFCTFVTGEGKHSFKWVEFVIVPLSIYIYISYADIYKFKRTLLKYLVSISAISILVQICHIFWGMFPASAYINGNGEIRYLSLHLFNTEWGGEEANRLASIFWEPGQYQIVIVYILALFADEWSDLSSWRKNIKKYGILLVALILTHSTMAYIALAIITTIILARIGIKNLSYVPLCCILGLGAFFLIFNSNAVQSKIKMSENENETSSYTIRLADNIACLEATFEKPFTGYGVGSDVLEKRLSAKGSMTASNGWLYASAQLGIPFVLMMLFFILDNSRKFCKNTNSFLIFILLFIVHCNEYSITLPYMFLWIYEMNAQTIKNE